VPAFDIDQSVYGQVTYPPSSPQNTRCHREAAERLTITQTGVTAMLP
jgi:hypothetical protein